MRYRCIVRYPAGKEPERPSQEFCHSEAQADRWAAKKMEGAPTGAYVEIFEMTERLVREVR